MMKYFLLLVGLVAAVLAALMYVPAENGRPVLDPDSMRQLLSESTSMVIPAEEEVLPAMYRWRDESGRWQYGQIPPPGVRAEPVEQKDTRTVSPDALRQGALPEDSQ